MSVEYDLIIFGATPAGIEAAIAAATLKARVALITQGISPNTAPELLSQQTLLHLAHTNEQLHQPELQPLWQTAPATLQWEWVDRWLNAITVKVETTRTGAELAYQGVDVIPAMGEFCRKPVPGVVVGDRFLQARGYLLTMGSRTLVPAIAGLETVEYLTPETVPHNLQELAKQQKIAVIGHGKTAIELAQALTRLNQEVVILTEHQTLLPSADLEITQWLQAQLEAEGVRILADASITEVQQQAGKKQIGLGETNLAVDEIIVAAGHCPNLESLNLDAVGVRWNASGIDHNEKLQTTNPHIYACEGRVGSECFAHVARHEAAIARQNSLFLPRSTVNYHALPFTVHTSPAAAWIGLTETQAMRHYDPKNIYILRQAIHTLPQAQLRDELTGFCKLIVHRNGKLLGAHLIGTHVNEFIGILALAMQQGLKIGAIATLALPSPTMAEILNSTAADFRRLQLKHTHWLQDLIDHFFDLRRSWSSGN